MASSIPSGLRDEVEKQTGSVIASEKPRGGGGASRQGAEVVLRTPDGNKQRCYLAWDARAGDPSRLPYFERETTILKALSGPFGDCGVKVAPLVAAFPSHLALLSQFVSGNDRFPQAENKQELAAEFVSQLAALHQLDAKDPAFAALGDATERPSERIRSNLEKWSRENLKSLKEPIFQLALEWLIRNVPEDRGPSMVLHGDAGPGNFLFEDGKISAIVDWELTHLGDPMEDLAQIWVRSLIQPFVPMEQVFESYAKASGEPVDVARVQFHRLYFQLSFSVPSSVLSSAEGSKIGATGTALMFGTMHKRVMVRSVAELSGISVVEPDLPIGKSDWTDRYFETALRDLKNDIVPAIGNQRATAKAKELARLIKFWRNRARWGASFDAQELSEIRRSITNAPDELMAARAALADAIATGTIDFRVATQLCYSRVMRETAIMEEAMGALSRTWYEPNSN